MVRVFFLVMTGLYRLTAALLDQMFVSVHTKWKEDSRRRGAGESELGFQKGPVSLRSGMEI